MTLRFLLLPQLYAVVQLPSDASWPSWASGGEFTSISRTRDELSIICEERLVPPDVAADRGWRCLALEGPFPLTAVGVAAVFTSVLARSEISVLIVSTYNTDYALLKDGALERAVAALERAGHRVTR